MNDTFAIIYAAHGNPRLGTLIEQRSVAALQLAGRYRTIDVTLTNIARSGIRTVGLITQRNYQSLIDHVGSGRPWDLSGKSGGITLLPPYNLDGSTGRYHGISDALFAKRDYLEDRREKYCLLLRSNIVYREDYTRLLDRHLESQADITLLYARGPKPTDESSNPVYLQVEDGWVRKLGHERVGMADNADVCYALGAVLMSKDLLVRLVEDSCAAGHYHFVTDILEPALSDLRIAAVEHTGYVARISSVKSYFDMNRDMLSPEVRASLFIEGDPVYTRVMDAPPVRFNAGCEVSNSVFGNGCSVQGRVVGCVVSRGVQVERGADVQDCVVMQDSVIGAGAHLRNVIVDKDVVIDAGVRIIGMPDAPVVIRKGAHIDCDL